MRELIPTLQQIAADLFDLGQHWALVGGLAVSARTEPRTTRDVDVAVLVDGDSSAEKLVHGLRNRGYTIPDRGIVEQKAVGRISTVRLVKSESIGTSLVVDLLFASSGIEPEIVSMAEVLEILPGVRVPVAKVGHLLAVKALAGRPQDLQDFENLTRQAKPEDLLLARDAVDKIARRGYDREEDLPRKLEDLLDRFHAKKTDV